MTEVVGLIVDADERVGTGGFLAIRRLRLRNRRADGSASAGYVCDAVVRPYGQDAIVVAVWGRRGGEVVVLVREGLRPALTLGRDPARAPLPEPAPGLWVTELVAGIVEAGDHGEAGLRARAVAEVAEEAGFEVGADDVALLGPGMLPSPGVLTEKFYFAAVRVDPSRGGALAGDGSPMEEGARVRWLPLADALAACADGTICDLKTEVGLRRLADWLARADAR